MGAESNDGGHGEQLCERDSALERTAFTDKADALPGGMKLTAEEPLLEREAELSALERLISDVTRGSGRLALIEGEAGIGKTRLLGAATERARERGFTVLFARGGERERDFAFGVVRQLLEPVLRAAAPADREQLMAGAASFSEAVFAEPAADTQRSADPSTLSCTACTGS